jgi:hypothetical protein
MLLEACYRRPLTEICTLGARVATSFATRLYRSTLKDSNPVMRTIRTGRTVEGVAPGAAVPAVVQMRNMWDEVEDEVPICDLPGQCYMQHSSTL